MGSSNHSFIRIWIYVFQNTQLSDEMLSLERTNEILDSEVENLDVLNADYKEETSLAFIKD
jgi:hypothetical protein